MAYIAAWLSANLEMLDDVGLGVNCDKPPSTEETFVIGIFLSTAATKNSVPLVFQADAEYMSFGKYTLYSC